MALPKARPKTTKRKPRKKRARPLAKKKRKQRPSKKSRSAAAKKGWETRRRKALLLTARLQTAGKLGIKGFTDRKTGKYIQRIAYDSERGKSDYDTLWQMKDTEDPRWLDFYDFLSEMGFDDQDINDTWFSPDF